MQEKRKSWAEMIAKLMGIAEEVFADIEGFKKGSLILEVEADLDMKFIISKEDSGSLKAEFTVSPKVPEKKEESAPIEEIFEGEEKEEGTEPSFY